MEKTLNNKFVCAICKKKVMTGYNRPHSLHRTKRKVLPNVQKINGSYICTRCLRTRIKKS